MELCRKEYEQTAARIDDELTRFDMERIRGLEQAVIEYAMSLKNSQQCLIQIWEEFSPMVQ